MKMYVTFPVLVLTAVSCLFYSTSIRSESLTDILKYNDNKVSASVNGDSAEQIIYTSPVDGARFIMPGNNIIIRTSSKIMKSTIGVPSLFKVTGSVSGDHTGKVILTGSGSTVLFLPDEPYAPGEAVTVELNKGLKTIDGKDVETKQFKFYVAAARPDENFINEYNANRIKEEFKEESENNTNTSSIFSAVKKVSSAKDLPDDFPALTVLQSNNPTPGYIFLSNFSLQADDPYGNYLMIVDNEGNPIFYRKMSKNCFDLKMQPNGMITYFDGAKMKDYEMNTSFAVVDSFTCGNGYGNDAHDFRILPDGHVWLLCDDWEYVDMSKMVQGGNPDARVMGIIVQELDKNKHVVFQWRSWDHFKITDATHEDLTAATIDYVHSNAIEIDPDGNILLSSRHLDEITKINTQTGDIIWRLGGKNNQFTFINDPYGFSHQHSVRRLANGDITLFDNGNFHNPPFSRAVEYKLDEVNKTADLVWQYRNNPDIYGTAMGYVQRLDNGNTFIGWGTANPTVIETKPDGSIALELNLPENEISYRAYKFPFIILNSPNGGEDWEANSTHMISWTSSGVGSVNIDYSTDNGATWNRIVSSYTADSAVYAWRIPDTLATKCLIRISAAGTTDIPISVISDSLLSIENSLPVELVSFSAAMQNGIINLSWTTATEKNNYGFEVQRKYTAGDWQDIGFVKSQGNSLSITNYSYQDNLDTSAFVGVIYYRLKQMDLNGNAQYLKQTEINIDILPKSYSLFNNYPNPFNPSTVIKYALPVDSRVTVKVYNIVGQLVKTLVNFNQTAGEHKVLFNADGLPSGVYFDYISTQSLDGNQSFTTVKKMMLLK